MGILKKVFVMLKVLRVSDVGSAPGENVGESLRERGNSDDLDRDVYGLLGLPIDAINFANLLQSMDAAKDASAPFLVSTPNVNFLVKSQTNAGFRESILASDLCLADGMPLIWIAKLLRVPIHERVAGADLFVKLKSTVRAGRPLRIFLVGGAEGAAERVRAKLNSEKCGLECVGALNPGFGTVEQMSSQGIIDAINASCADLLALFFGAEKAQQWLIYNHHRLQPPIRAQFGATINFEAGTVKRAPQLLRSTGFEWLWRIKEEPYLWRRYWNDGKALLRLLVTCVLPLAITARRANANFLTIEAAADPSSVTLRLSGSATVDHIDQAIDQFRAALAASKQIVVDLAHTDGIDPRFFGLLLMVRKCLASRGKKLVFAGMSPEVRRMFSLNRFDYLLSS
jgi:N-acetylglucosaminyldiphosphoundecaprenol N-acetyl-beta-D-mannosaminyltransferase